MNAQKREVNIPQAGSLAQDLLEVGTAGDASSYIQELYNCLLEIVRNRRNMREEEFENARNQVVVLEDTWQPKLAKADRF